MNTQRPSNHDLNEDMIQTTNQSFRKGFGGFNTKASAMTTMSFYEPIKPFEQYEQVPKPSPFLPAHFKVASMLNEKI